MLLGADAKRRLEIVKKVKDLYKTRSAIVHSGKAEIDIQDIHRIWTFMRAAITKLMTVPSLSQLKSIEDLDDFLKLKKFGFELI